MPTEKYARPGLYLDEDDHGRLIEENREAYIREEAQRINDRLAGLRMAQEHGADVQDEIDHAEDRLDELKEMSHHD